LPSPKLVICPDREGAILMESRPFTERHVPKPLSLALVAALLVSGPVAAEPDLGSYLAARQAG